MAALTGGPHAAGGNGFDGQTLGGPGARAGTYLQLMGAAASVALVAGGVWWGVSLMLRDASGVPVVRAMEGPMRLSPENPGGEVADHAGLAVNAIAAEGQAAAPEERLVLAPAASDLQPRIWRCGLAPRRANLSRVPCRPTIRQTPGPHPSP